jgi:hypothetical protein
MAAPLSVVADVDLGTASLFDEPDLTYIAIVL